MLKKIHLPIGFRYRECDSFADYLHEQALKGWHFKEFRLGMVFEKGESEDRYYLVEIFPEEGEWDFRPDDDTMESISRYEESGWKFIDSIRKFCVFERTCESASNITTEEEKFAAVWKAEKRYWFVYHAFVFLLFLFVIPCIFLPHFYNFAFHPALLFIISICFLKFMLSAGYGISLLLWHRRAKKSLKETHSVSYKRSCRFLYMLDPFLLICMFFGILCYAFGDSNTGNGLSALLIILIVAVYNVGFSMFRPNRRQQMNARMISVFAILVLFITFSIVYYNKDYEPSHVPIPTSATLPLATFTNVPLAPDAISDYKYSKSILGSKESCEAWYSEEPASDSTHTFHYHIYTTPYQWVRNYLWKHPEPDSLKNPLEWSDCTEQWNGLEARKTQHGFGVRYSVLYEHIILDLWLDQSLSPETIKKIESSILKSSETTGAFL